MHGSCECGAVRVEARSTPPVRFFCHCRICQAIYELPFADITATWTWNLRVVEGADLLHYHHYRWFPVSVNRAVCTRCKRPVLGRLQLPFPGVTFVPAALWGEDAALPDPVGHIFYDRRVADVEDGLPKTEGFFPSELRASAWMLPRLLRGFHPERG